MLKGLHCGDTFALLSWGLSGTRSFSVSHEISSYLLELLMTIVFGEKGARIRSLVYGVQFLHQIGIHLAGGQGYVLRLQYQSRGRGRPGCDRAPTIFDIPTTEHAQISAD